LDGYSNFKETTNLPQDNRLISPYIQEKNKNNTVTSSTVTNKLQLWTPLPEHWNVHQSNIKKKKKGTKSLSFFQLV
jgi:hypothetical protein